MSKYIVLAFKGALMGAANVIPGVSGGTMALLTGIFERLINAIKSFNLNAFSLLKAGKIKQLCEHIDLTFLMAIGVGVVISVLSFARILEYLFDHQSLYVWAFFFGLILASVYFVGRKIGKITRAVILFFFIGSIVASAIAFVKPAAENSSTLYLILCGAVAMCSMILPGLSGSYVLLLMGNYQLVMIESIAHFQLSILIPVGVGAVIGLLLFSHVLAWVFKNFHDQTLALLTGFIFGSLCILWPWKTEILTTFQAGDRIKEKVIGYTYNLPEPTLETAIAIAIMITGITIIALTEVIGNQKKDTQAAA